MSRLLFEKTGNAVWMSHLDLMRLFQRAFKRAGLELKHTQGFSPRPSVSIALPLSVGVESRCELLDFELIGEQLPNDEIHCRLNGALVEGVKVRQVYDDARKIKDLCLLECLVTLEYDRGIPDGAAVSIQGLFNQEELLVEKRSKNGFSEQNIISMIRRFSLSEIDRHTLQLRALVSCQNPSLNPAQLVAAIERYVPEFRPDFSKCSRVEIYDSRESIFR